MRKLYIILFFSSVGQVSGQTIPWAPKKIDTSYAKLSKENVDLRIELDRLIENNDRQFANLDIQISATSTAMNALSIVLGLVGIGIGGYVSFIWNKIKKSQIVQEESTKQSESARILAQEAEKNSQEFFISIRNDINKIYAELKRSDIMHALDRIKEDPNEIIDLYYLLKGNNLQSEDFYIIKNSFLSGKNLVEGARKNYIDIFCKHFLLESVNDKDLEKTMFSHAVSLLRSGYQNIETINFPIQRFFTTHIFTDEEASSFLDQFNNISIHDLDKPFEFILKQFDTIQEAINFCTKYKANWHVDTLRIQTKFLMQIARLYEKEPYLITESGLSELIDENTKTLNKYHMSLY